MGKITNIEYFRVLPRWLFVKVTDEDGNFGWGESTLEGHTEAIEGALDEMVQVFTGYNADNIEHIWQTAWRLGFYRGGAVFMSALSGIDIALWDLKGKKLNVPIYQLLGGSVRDKLKVYCWIGGNEPDLETVKQQAPLKVAEGFKVIKMNATSHMDFLDSASVLKSCIERVKAAKEAGLEVALDFHGRLHKPMAKQLARALEPYDLLFIEEPLLSEHPEAIEKFSAQVVTPVALGERLYHRWDIKPFLEASSVDILQPDVSHVGGISELKRIANMAEAYDVAVAPHCPLGPISLAASMQVDCNIANFAIQEMSVGIHYNTVSSLYNSKESYDILSYIKKESHDVFKVVDGYVARPTGPGLGIEIDEEKIREVASGKKGALEDCQVEQTKANKDHTKVKAWRAMQFHGPDGAIREW
ncbi:mandelate racemase/muconate lactonizing enzyme family protein [Ascobolus immersus RN42]|uniref:Mandelate racemase/muconate lactonizing enzyme family protein n=1 Tax=Ascobolus immersus RN42 TaxID=1160509 RepID=A0A3N4HJD9_ASCIM|nr:mandelate racemase/muconate lactonizing enzyme family protein [Ascobolus immersus RN42]